MSDNFRLHFSVFILFKVALVLLSFPSYIRDIPLSVTSNRREQKKSNVSHTLPHILAAEATLVSQIIEFSKKFKSAGVHQELSSY